MIFSGRFKPWEIACLEFSLEPVEFLHWYGLLQCIPTEWKQKLHRDTFSRDSNRLYRERRYKNNTVQVLDTSRKSIYRSLVQSKFKPPTSKQYFTDKVDISGDADKLEEYSLFTTLKSPWTLRREFFNTKYSLLKPSDVSYENCVITLVSFFVESHWKQ